MVIEPPTTAVYVKFLLQ